MKYVFKVITVLMCGIVLLAAPGFGIETRSAQPVEKTSADLATALKYYYDGEYGKALPIFKNLSDRLQTLDLMFWTGTSASRTGDCGLAIDQLQKIVSKSPDSLRARLELGIAYDNCGQTEASRAEFEKILAASPPPEIKNIVNSYMAQPKQKKFAWDFRLSQAYQYDSNVNSGPSSELINDDGVVIRLSPNAKEQDSSNWITDMRGDMFYDIGAAGGFLWNGGAGLYYLHSFEDTDYNYMSMDIFTGPWWTDKKNIFRMPVGYTYKNYGTDSLSDTFYINPGMEHFFCQYFSLSADYQFSSEAYDDSAYTDAGYDNDTHRFSGGPNFYLKNRKVILSGLVTYEDSDADKDVQSYEAYHTSLSLFTQFETGTDMFLLYKYSDKEYEAPAPIFNTKREDTRHTLVGMVVQNFMKRYFVSAELAYINNDSNFELYDFDKTTFTVSAGVKF
jgi:hypothetical protein